MERRGYETHNPMAKAFLHLSSDIESREEILPLEKSTNSVYYKYVRTRNQPTLDT